MSGVNNVRSFSLNDYQIQNYDLLIVDYELEKNNGDEKNIYGSEIINLVRKGNFVNDVLFYSSYGFDIINQVMRNEGLQGVFIADRANEEFMEVAHLLIDKAIRRAENLVNIRGVVMDATSDFSAYRQARLLSWCIDANDELRAPLYEIVKKHIGAEEMNQAKNFFDIYNKDVILYRNALAHVKNSPI